MLAYMDNESNKPEWLPETPPGSKKPKTPEEVKELSEVESLKVIKEARARMLEMGYDIHEPDLRRESFGRYIIVAQDFLKLEMIIADVKKRMEVRKRDLDSTQNFDAIVGEEILKVGAPFVTHPYAITVFKKEGDGPLPRVDRFEDIGHAIDEIQSNTATPTVPNKVAQSLLNEEVGMIYREFVDYLLRRYEKFGVGISGQITFDQDSDESKK